MRYLEFPWLLYIAYAYTWLDTRMTVQHPMNPYARSEWIRASQQQHYQVTHEGHAHMHVRIAGCVTIHTANLAY